MLSGVPTNVAVPSVLSINDNHVGNVPVVVMEAVGVPVVVTVKLPSVPPVKVVLAALVILGATGGGGAS